MVKNPCQFCKERVKIYMPDDEVLLRGGQGQDSNGHYHLNCLPKDKTCSECGKEK